MMKRTLSIVGGRARRNLDDEVDAVLRSLSRRIATLTRALRMQELADETRLLADAAQRDLDVDAKAIRQYAAHLDAVADGLEKRG